MNPLRIGLVVLVLSACHSVAQPGSHVMSEARRDPSPTPDAEAPRRTSQDAGTSIATPPPPAAPLRWGKAPDPKGELFTAIEGHCPDLRISLLSNATIVHHGTALAQVSTDGLKKLPSKLDSNDVSSIHEIHGHWPDSAWLTYDNGGRCMFQSNALRFSEASQSWRPAFAAPETHGVTSVQPYMGGALGLLECMSCGVSPNGCKSSTFLGSGVKPPPLTGDGFTVADYATLPTGDVFAVGSVCDATGAGCNGQFRWWSPGAKVGWMPLGSVADSRMGHVLVRSKTDVIVSQGAYLGAFDGAKLEKLSAPSKQLGALFDAGADGFWIIADDRDGNGGGAYKMLHRKTDGTYDDVTPPKARGAKYVSEPIPVGVGLGTPWTFVGDDVYKREAGAWRKVELPKPAFAFSAKSYFTPSSIYVAAPDDVWIIAHYYEKQENWNFREVRAAALHSKPLAETFRCEAGTDGVRPAGFTSWPGAANDACKTPFLLLAPISATSPKDFDYPQTRAVLRPKAALVEGATLREIRENGTVWIGVVPRSVEDGRTLADVFAKSFPLSRAELLCVEANVTRTIPIESPKKN